MNSNFKIAKRELHAKLGRQDWRAPEGTGGPRDRPLRAARSRVAIPRAAGPHGAQNTSGATSNAGGGPPSTGTPSSPAQQRTTRRGNTSSTTSNAGTPAAPQTAKPPGPAGAGRLTQYQWIIEESRQYRDYRDRFPGAHSRFRASKRCPWRCLPSGDPRRRR